MTADNATIRKMALKHGFKLKKQPDGEIDLNPYVYEFAKALLSEHSMLGVQVRVTHTDEVDCMINGAKVGQLGIIVKVGAYGYHSIYLNEVDKVVVLYPSQFELIA